MNNKNILDYIIENKTQMTKKQILLANYILENYKDMPFMTVDEIANNIGVGKTTVLRFSKMLGYESFFDLRKEFLNIYKDSTDKWKNVESSYNLNEQSDSSHILYTIWGEGINTLNKSFSPELLENFQDAIKLLCSSKHIHLLGFRPYKSLALYMEALLNEFEPYASLLTSDADTILDRVMLIDNDDVILVIGFSPYSNRVIEAINVASQREIPVILITDEYSNPMISDSTIVLKLNSNSNFFSVVPIILLIESLVVEYGRQNAPKSGENIKKLSQKLKEQDHIIGNNSFNLNIRKKSE